MTRNQRNSLRAGFLFQRAHSQPDQIDRDFRAAVQLLQNGQLQESQQLHRRILAKLPRHAPSLHHLGLIAFKNKSLAEAVDYIQQSVAIDPRYSSAWLNLAVILGDLRRTNEGIEACRRCLALEPSNAEAHAVLGNLHRQNASDADAIPAYTASLKIKPHQPALLTKLGEVLLKVGEIDAASARCRMALKQEPAFHPAVRLERRILALTGALEAASASIDTISDPSERSAEYGDLGTFLCAEGHHATAVALHRRALQQTPDRAETYFNLALALERLGQGHDALSAYREGLAIDPDHALGYLGVALLLRGMKMHAGAITALEHAIALDPTLASAHYNLALAYKLLGQYDKARAAFSAAIACAPDAVIARIEFCNLRRVLCDWVGLEQEEDCCAAPRHWFLPSS
jgi:protein O-GlcNAc transferase